MTYKDITIRTIVNGFETTTEHFNFNFQKDWNEIETQSLTKEFWIDNKKIKFIVEIPFPKNKALMENEFDVLMENLIDERFLTYASENLPKNTLFEYQRDFDKERNATSFLSLIDYLYDFRQPKIDLFKNQPSIENDLLLQFEYQEKFVIQPENTDKIETAIEKIKSDPKTSESIKDQLEGDFSVLAIDDLDTYNWFWDGDNKEVFVDDNLRIALQKTFFESIWPQIDQNLHFRLLKAGLENVKLEQLKDKKFSKKR